jgi:hypothetical protein
MSNVTPDSTAASAKGASWKQTLGDAIDFADLRSVEKQVLRAIWRHLPSDATSDSPAWPSQNLISLIAGCSTRTVQDTLPAVAAAGWLTVTEEPREGDGALHDVYRMQIPVGTRTAADVKAIVAEMRAADTKRRAAGRARQGGRAGAPKVAAPNVKVAAVATPVRAPLSAETAAILATLVTLPTLAHIANDNGAATLAAVVVDAETGEVATPARVIRAVTKQAAYKHLAGKGGMLKQAAEFVRNEGDAPAPKPRAPKLVVAPQYKTFNTAPDPVPTPEARARANAAGDAAYADFMARIGPVGAPMVRRPSAAASM